MSPVKGLHPVFAEVLSSPLCERLVQASVELAILALLVWGAIRLLRIRTARACALLWLLVMAKAVVGPIYSGPVQVASVPLAPPASVVGVGSAAPAGMPESAATPGSPEASATAGNREASGREIPAVDSATETESKVPPVVATGPPAVQKVDSSWPPQSPVQPDAEIEQSEPVLSARASESNADANSKPVRHGLPVYDARLRFPAPSPMPAGGPGRLQR